MLCKSIGDELNCAHCWTDGLQSYWPCVLLYWCHVWPLTLVLQIQQRSCKTLVRQTSSTRSQGLLPLAHKSFADILHSKQHHKPGYTWKYWKLLGASIQRYTRQRGSVNSLRRSPYLSAGYQPRPSTGARHEGPVRFGNSVYYKGHANHPHIYVIHDHLHSYT